MSKKRESFLYLMIHFGKNMPDYHRDGVGLWFCNTGSHNSQIIWPRMSVFDTNYQNNIDIDQSDAVKIPPKITASLFFRLRSYYECLMREETSKR
jgi:hypothetical protein